MVSPTAALPKTGYLPVLRVAGLIVLSNISTPLLGIADMAVLGHLPNAAYIGAIALAGTVFSFLYWMFGFLRMGTTGLTAQAVGAADPAEIRASLGRALLVAAAMGLLLILLQVPIRIVAFRFLDVGPEVARLTAAFYDIRIWSAPFTLANFALLGWFIGRRRAGIGLALQVSMNLANIALNLTFVLGLGWDVRGVATGTVIAELLACLLGLGLAGRDLRRVGGRWNWQSLLDKARLKRTVAVNRDIMLRSLALIFALAFFTTQGAKAGDVTLAANAVLFQFITVSAFILDAFAFTTEALVGEAIGIRSRQAFRDAVWYSSVWAVALSALLSVAAWLAGPLLIDGLTTEPAVRAAARHFLPWAAAGPFVSVWCFLLDGVFIGATWTVQMRNAMALSLVLYLGVAWLLIQGMGNSGLWAALLVFYLLRAATLAWSLPQLARGVSLRSA